MELTGLAARDKILVTLKREGPSFVHELASILGVTPNAVRHQLNVLLADDLVRQSPVRRSVGRPAHLFQLTEKGERLFPDDYAGLALDLLEGIAEKGAWQESTSCSRGGAAPGCAHASRNSRESISLRKFLC